MSPTWETASDWDTAQSETSVHHEQPTGTDWAMSDVLEKGPPSNVFGNKSPVAFWPMNEDSGTTINDVTGNGYDMDAGGATPNASGVLGHSAWSFDGQDDKSTTSKTASISSHTFGAWVSSTDSGDWNGIIVNHTTVTPYTQMLFQSGRLGVQIEDGNGNEKLYISSSGTYDDGTWHLFGGSYDANADTLTLFVDGVNPATNKATDNVLQSFTVNEPFGVGATRDDYQFLTGDVCYAFVDDEPWTESEWSDYYDGWI